MTPKKIVDAIEQRLGILGQPTQVRDAIELSLLEDFKLTSAEAAEQSDKLLGKIRLEIRRRQNEKEATGEIAIIHLRGNLDEILHGSSFVFSDDSVELQNSKRYRTAVNEIYAAIRKLTFSEFELFGRCVLREVGCHLTNVTRHAGDQGIDFYGELTVGKVLNAHPATLKLIHDTKVVIVGQAKHYPDRSIGPSIVRELVGALSLSRTRTFSNSSLDILDDVELRPFSPVLAMLFSTGEFTAGARVLSERAGLISFSGWQLSVFLADKGIGIVENGDLVSFDSERFQKWLV